jgi:hypothetical protein
VVNRNSFLKRRHGGAGFDENREIVDDGVAALADGAVDRDGRERESPVADRANEEVKMIGEERCGHEMSLVDAR